MINTKTTFRFQLLENVKSWKIKVNQVLHPLFTNQHLTMVSVTNQIVSCLPILIKDSILTKEYVRVDARRFCTNLQFTHHKGPKLKST